MTTIRPNAEPAATVVAVGDIFLIDGATGVRALAASSVAVADVNGNVANINNLVSSFASIATAGGTTVLTAASAKTQYFTGTLNQTVTLPVTSTLYLNHTYIVENASTGVITVNSSGGNLVSAVAPGATVDFSCVSLTGTTAASWSLKFDSTVVASGKLLTVNNSLTLAGTDGTTMTFPATSATIARTDAGQTFTGTQAFGALTATSVNGNTITTGTGVLTLGAGKTLTANNSLTLAGTDGTTMTFPATSATLARTDTAQTFTGTQAITGGGISFATSGQGHIGTATNDNANAGVLGEYVESVIASGSAVALTTSTGKDVTTISLTAGDWDVSGNIAFVPTSTTSFTQVLAGIASSANTIDSSNGRSAGFEGSAQVPGVAFGPIFSVGPVRFSLSGTTTLHLVAQSVFTASTMNAYGIIRARRIR